MVTEWDTNQYLKFESQRTQPAVDLVSRLKDLRPKSVIDIGCGTGTSTKLLLDAFPEALVVGLDSSSEMLDKARANLAGATFEQGDARHLEGSYDLIFSNACFQWIPDHDEFIPFLMRHLNEGGTLAAQFPMNQEEPLFRAIADVAAEPRWQFESAHLDHNGTLEPEEYFDLLSTCSSSFQVWETKYYHSMKDHESLLEWVRGSRLRPYLAALTEEEGRLFEEEILERVRESYPVKPCGGVLLRFNRFFLTAVR